MIQRQDGVAIDARQLSAPPLDNKCHHLHLSSGAMRHEITEVDAALPR